MEQIVVQTEVQPDGNILLFYVDENNEVDPSLLENEQDNTETQPETKYIIEDNGEGESADELDIAQATEQVAQEKWSDEEIKRLIVFYTDNKKTFVNGTTKKKHLWAVACRTMLTERNPISCEIKLRLLKQKYIHMCLERQKGNNVYGPYFELCHKAFHDDSCVLACLNGDTQSNAVINVPITTIVNEDGVIVFKKINYGSADEKVEAMLNLYIKHKNLFMKTSLPKNIWDIIALELGQEDGEYWHKRFLNFKQHYVRMLHKRKESGDDSVNWPYMYYFDQIFGSDDDFNHKNLLTDTKENIEISLDNEENIWYDTEKIFLIKYYFDCFHEFQDPTIPNDFLWHEVGRLLNKSPENCKIMLEELKEVHVKRLVNGGYDLGNRLPLEILLDNIIAKETETILSKPYKITTAYDTWETDQLDELVQYLYDNMVMLKDSVCYYVCWAVIAKKLNRTAQSCKKQWNDLTKLYKSILNDKKENSDMHIDWRYIDVFDIIFDYGMDTKLLDGYEKSVDINKQTKPGVKKITFKDTDDNISEDEESYDERGFMKRTKKHTGDEKAFKLLEYYLKNKDKFSSSQQKKLALWQVLGKQIGVSATECAHRFRNFKQVYIAYVQREVNKPEMPILWPYYSLCKKVFGYRAIKSKLKNGKMDTDEIEDWSAKEIKQVINHLATYYNEIAENSEDESVWFDLSQEMGRSASTLRDKFLELRKSYRKLKTMKTRNPDVKVNWKYFNMMDSIYNQVQTVENTMYMEVDGIQSFDVIGKTEPQDDDDFQCIIVMPDGEEMFYGNENAVEEIDQKLIVKTETQPRMFKWNKQSKKHLLISYLNYLKTNNRRNNPKEIWNEISAQFGDKTPAACKNMFVKLRRNHNTVQGRNSPYCKLMDKILSLKKVKMSDTYENIYNDVEMSDDKVLKALNYYLHNIEDFASTKVCNWYDKTNVWHELARHVNEPVNTVFNKINYLKNNFTDDSPFREILNEILLRQNELLNETHEENSNLEDKENTWSDIETEKLLTWYLAHLDKFKNPIFVRSYLWMEASDILKKSPLACSKKMSEIRSEYRCMVKKNPEDLEQWRFYNLCQRIYGTGRRGLSNS